MSLESEDEALDRAIVELFKTYHGVEISRGEVRDFRAALDSNGLTLSIDDYSESVKTSD